MNIRPLSPELQEKAKEINEDPNRISDDIQHIKTWVQKQPHLSPRLDDQWILNFLRGCKFSLERTKEKFDAYYSLRSLMPEVYKNRDPRQKHIQELLDEGLMLPLPELTPDGRRVIIARNSHYDPEKFHLDQIFQMNSIINDILQNEDDVFVLAGAYNIADMKDLSMGHAAQFTLNQMKKMGYVTTHALPVRPKGIFFVNAPSIFDTIYKMMLPFIPDKIKGRVMTISKEVPMEIFDVIPKKIMPPEYGGEGMTIDELIIYWKKKVESYRDWFIEDQKYGTDEKKRPGKPRTADGMFGIEGSFRKLNVD